DSGCLRYLCGLHALDDGNELLERLSPTLLESHLLVFLATLLVPVHDEGGIPRPIAVRFQGEDRRERELLTFGSLGRRRGGPIARCEGIGPDELFVRDDLEETTDAGELLSLRRAHHRTKDPARAQIDFAIDRRPGRGGEPFL